METIVLTFLTDVLWKYVFVNNNRGVHFIIDMNRARITRCLLTCTSLLTHTHTHTHTHTRTHTNTYRHTHKHLCICAHANPPFFLQWLVLNYLVFFSMVLYIIVYGISTVYGGILNNSMFLYMSWISEIIQGGILPCDLFCRLINFGHDSLMNRKIGNFRVTVGCISIRFTAWAWLMTALCCPAIGHTPRKPLQNLILTLSISSPGYRARDL